jgi:hypothetical protein
MEALGATDQIDGCHGAAVKDLSVWGAHPIFMFAAFAVFY